MTTKGQVCRAFIAAARPTASLFSAAGLLLLAGAGGGRLIWRNVLTAETLAMVSFFGYAIFVLIPIRLLSGCAFIAAVAVGTVLAIGSVSWSTQMYGFVLNDLFESQMVFRAMAWILLIPIYAYIPMAIWQRKQGAANSASSHHG